MHSNNNKKYIFNVLLVISVTIIAMYFALKDNFKAILKAIASMNIFSLLLVLAWGLGINVVIGLGYTLLARKCRSGYTLKEGTIVAFVGTFFAGITPSSTGGQFGQIYVLKKQGIGYSDGLSLLWADFIIYQTTMMIYVTLLFVLRFTHYVNMNAWIWLVGAGYLVNVVVIAALYTIALFPKVYIWGSAKVVKILGKLHILKDPERQAEIWASKMAGFTQEIKTLADDKKLLLQVGLVNMARLTLYFSLPFVVALSLGIKVGVSDFIDMLALSSFVTMANCFVPLPGASGGTEVFFTMLFQGILGKLTGAVLLLWRFSSYYLPVIVGALVFLFFKNHEDAKDDPHFHPELKNHPDSSGKSQPPKEQPENRLPAPQSHEDLQVKAGMEPADRMAISPGKPAS